METKVTEVTIITVSHGPTVRAADLALALAILSREPSWPRETLAQTGAMVAGGAL
jgi:hypothetical protein